MRSARREEWTAGRQVREWAASGAMALTGRAGEAPLGPPAGLVPALHEVAGRLARASAHLGGTVTVDPVALLGERAAVAGLTRHGATSCGGATRLVRAADGWIAVALARPDDVALVPAWLERPGGDDPWLAVHATVAARPAADLAARGRLLGLPVAVLPAARAGSGDPLGAVEARPVAGPVPAAKALAETVVVDLSALWAGPLCGALLAAAGATVVKVESPARPDGARRGPAPFFDLLNGGKRSVAVDFAGGDRRILHELIGRADVVIEASRPRALEQLGVDARSVVARGPRVWVSLTGYGRHGAGRDWVAFGDDAAVAGGLVVHDDRGPCFCADAVADPVSGLVASAAVLEALARGGRWVLDVPLAGVAAAFAGPTLPVAGASPAEAPRARPVRRAAPALGADTGRVLRDLGIAG